MSFGMVNGIEFALRIPANNVLVAFDQTLGN
jgi:hypothetical protein